MTLQMISEYFSRDFVYATYVGFRDFLALGRPGDETIEGKTVIITGGSSGIGKETAVDLSRRGGRVIITCRNLQRGKAAVEYIREKVPKADVSAMFLDFRSLASVHKFAVEILAREKYIHILINNAGTFEDPGKTEDGFEVHFGVNYLGHFLLTNLLFERIKASAPARIISVSSFFHTLAAGKLDFNDLGMKEDISPLQAYCQSKLCNILFSRFLAKKLKGTGVSTYSLHPGGVNTGLNQSSTLTSVAIFRKIGEYLFLSPEDGARTIIYCAVDESIKNDTGLYYCDCTNVQPSRLARDDELAERLWDESAKLVRLSGKILEKSP